MTCMFLPLAIAATLWVTAATPVFAADVVQPKAEPAALTAPSAPTAPQDELSNCAFITNDCEVCTVDASGKAFCSSQGIACVPTKRWCLFPKK